MHTIRNLDVIAKYSICIANKNMADTLKESIRSLYSTLNDEFEVIVVDDFSSDNSRKILLELQSEFPTLQLYFLGKDSSRRLGETRNISIQLSRTDWCIFHIDTDDKFQTGLVDFARNVENLSNLMNTDRLFAGSQVHMARRNFLLQFGPFRNIYRTEDRDLYIRLIPTNSLIFINHDSFIEPIGRKRVLLLKKNLKDNWDHLVTDLRFEESLLQYVFYVIWKRRKTIGPKVITFRVFFLLLAFLKARKMGSIVRESKDRDIVGKYRFENTRTFQEWHTLFRDGI